MILSGEAISPTIRGRRRAPTARGSAIPARPAHSRSCSRGWPDRCGRRLRSALRREDDVRVLQVLRQLPVVVHHAEVQGVDTLEIIRVQHVLCAGAGGGTLPQIRFEERHIGPRTERHGEPEASQLANRCDRSGSTSVNNTIPGAFSISRLFVRAEKASAREDKRVRWKRRLDTARPPRATPRSGFRR